MSIVAVCSPKVGLSLDDRGLEPVSLPHVPPLPVKWPTRYGSGFRSAAVRVCQLVAFGSLGHLPSLVFQRGWRCNWRLLGDAISVFVDRIAFRLPSDSVLRIGEEHRRCVDAAHAVRSDVSRRRVPDLVTSGDRAQVPPQGRLLDAGVVSKVLMSSAIAIQDL